MFAEPPAPTQDVAQPELRALLDRGVQPLKDWVCVGLAHAHPALGFHATSEWENNVLACYLSHFLPKLPPSGYYQQDVLVVHYPEHWQNECYNRIHTQTSGSCLIPDDFHAFLLEMTRLFGHRFIPVKELALWLESGTVLAPSVLLEPLLQEERLLQAIRQVEALEQGTIIRETVRVLAPLRTLEWIAILRQMRQDHPVFHTVLVQGERVTSVDSSRGADLWRWLADMRHRGYLSGHSSLPLHQAQALDETQLLQMAEQIQQVQANRAIRTFLEHVWGNLEQIDRFLFGTTTSFAETAISSITVKDALGQELLPDRSLPFWQKALHNDEMRVALQEAEQEDRLLEEVNTSLHRQGIFKEYGLPDPKSEHPAFQFPLDFPTLPLTYPRLFVPTIV